MTAPVSGVEGVVTEVLREHRPSQLRSWPMKCRCGAEHEDFQVHVAAAVVQALGLTDEHATIPEWYETGEMIQNRMVNGPELVPARSMRFVPKRRWVSPWVAVERGEP